MTVDDEASTARRRKAHHLCDQLGLERDERIALSETLLWRDVRSWSDLSDHEIRRMLDCLEGYLLVTLLKTGGTLPPPGR